MAAPIISITASTSSSPILPTTTSSSTTSTSSLSPTLPTITSSSTTSTSSSSPTLPTTTLSSSTTSHSSQQPADTASTTTHQSTTSSSSGQPSPTGTSTPQPNRLSNGAVAGIVIGIALGLSLLTFLVTFFIMRRQRLTKGDRRHRSTKEGGGFELNKTRGQDPMTTSGTPSTTVAPTASGTYEAHLPQSADDRTIQQEVRATLDQIELHVENFYRNTSSSSSRPDSANLAVFNSPYLPASLASLLPQAKNRVNLMKHALMQSATSSISPSAGPTRSFLPTEYTSLPSTIASARSSVPAKAGECHFTQCELANRRSIANSAQDLTR